jgi:hypothetical protein
LGSIRPHHFCSQAFLAEGVGLASAEAPARRQHFIDVPPHETNRGDDRLRHCGARGSVSTALNQTHRLSFCLSMIWSENRFPLFGIML